MSDPSHRPSFLARLALLFGSLFLMAAMGEAFLRVLDLFDPFDLQFYSIPDPDEQGVFRTAYGIVRSNSHGYPDAEFDLADSRPRVGYFGDSVTAGVGAGYGHRISEHLEESFPDYQHLTIAKMGDGAQDPEEGLRLVDKFGIDTYVYLMNLNDIMPVVPKPSDSSQKEPAGALRSLSKNSLFATIDELRLVSHLYNLIRMKTRNALIGLGFSHKGLDTFELRPSTNMAVLDGTIDRVNSLYGLLEEQGLRSCIVILPYEMQVSVEAEQFYSSRGITWEDGFIERGTQKLILERLDPEIEVIDAYYAFVDRDDVQASREGNALGEFFVTRGGGALDWNHPNRAGHRATADFLIEHNICQLDSGG